MKRMLYCGVAAIAIAAFLAATPAQLRAAESVAIDGDDVGGVVTGPHGPEAGCDCVGICPTVAAIAMGDN